MEQDSGCAVRFSAQDVLAALAQQETADGGREEPQQGTPLPYTFCCSCRFLLRPTAFVGRILSGAAGILSQSRLPGAS